MSKEITALDERIEVSLSRIEAIINSFRGNTFTTADVLRQYSGGFYSNIDTPAVYSFNAQFGKILKRNESVLNISEVNSGVKINDDNGHPTTTSEWKPNT
ncbi:MAG: hypothetical protein Q7U64_04610 [Desulfocapsaceae bacterium]|nr:hypothetical protein [Desulfocapsaceae bacterium]